ncbi:germin-like protein 8-2 [Aristolochia californica]|uniref:germin-like protein 8-2 n=1 Tax=Aristolochia californica TaxID=171875 RepID=UPI0035E05EB6
MLAFFLLTLASHAFASDPSPMHDFCVADLNNTVHVNGFVCKDPQLATADDFFLTGLDQPKAPSNPIGSAVTPVSVKQIPGLNSLGLSVVRIDYAPHGQNPPHLHPRASEIMIVLEGTLFVGFVTSNPENRLISKVLHKGDAFVFPVGLIHFQFNVGNTPAAAFAALSSQSPGSVTIANAIFGSNPPISAAVLDRAFHVDKKITDLIQSKF